MRIFLIILIVTSFCHTILYSQNRMKRLVIRNVTIVDVKNWETQPKKTVVISDEKIRFIGKKNEIKLSEEMEVIEAAGKFLIPGLWDMHVHPYENYDFQILVVNGVTGARIMWGTPDFIQAREKIKNGELLGPTLYIGGQIIEGLPPPELASVIPTKGKKIIQTAEEAATEVRLEKQEGYDFIKVYNNLSLAAYEGLVKEARKQNISVAGHVPFEVGLFGALKAGQSSIEHLRGYIQELVPPDAPIQPGADLRSRVLAWQYADPSKMKDLAEATQKAKVWNCPTLAIRIFDLPQAELDKYLVGKEAEYLPESAHQWLKERQKYFGWLSNFTDEDFVRATEGWTKKNELVCALSESGAKLLAGTDCSPWGFTLHRELKLLVEAGLTTHEVLKMATLNPAEFMGITDSFGSVEVGKVADLILLNANPLHDISHTRNIHAVILKGRLLNRDELDVMLADIKARIKADKK